MELENKLIEFRDVTLELMNQIKNEENREILFEKRGEILSFIQSTKFNSIEIVETIKKLKIDELEKDLYKKIKSEMNNLKLEMKNLKRSQHGNQVYITSRYGSDIKSRFDKIY